MKQLIFLCIAIFITGIVAVAQVQDNIPHRYPKCDTDKLSDTGYYMPRADEFLTRTLAQKNLENPLNDFSAPYYIRVFIRIAREDNGTLPGCTMETALQNFNEMNDQYNGHNICFQLVGMDFVNDSYLNNFNSSANIDEVYPDYIRDNNLDVDGAITIFIHYNYLFNSGSSGNAYGIPNNFLSVARWAVNGSGVHSIFGHEMGHCLGLYHTFQRHDGVQETVTRNSGNSCYNCTSEGDLCCDTPADYTDSQDNTSGTTCNYNGSTTNTCDGLQYNPSTINIMSYQPWSCISFTSTALTANQRTRMHASINFPLGPIFSRVAENNVVQTNTTTSSNAVRVYSAKDNYSTLAGSTISHTSSSKAYYAAGDVITFSPGVTFAPGSAGLVQASISGCN
ncbi:MAG: hypothetical protein H7Y86_16985 [Rhizobacter sp.]|nr:hypothetical protein [Ferruginibacter sp.]